VVWVLLIGERLQLNGTCVNLLDGQCAGLDALTHKDVLTLPASRLQQAQVADRRARAIALRIAHVPLAAIADQLGYTSPAAVSMDLKRALEQRRDALADQADTLAALESEKLDAVEQRMWMIISRRHAPWVGAAHR
jgi:hypothetical protein